MSFLLTQQDVSGHSNQPEDIKEKHEDLLIFGYHCKLFRDDARAAAIDSEEHLIPWMGDHSLKIDRYDGRGHLFDLWPYDADNKSGRGELTADEKRIEQLCEEERYLEMHTDIAEKALQEEEEIKRLNMELAMSSGYQAVGFSYDQPPGGEETTAEDDEKKEDEEDDYEFVPPKELCLPKSMAYPSSGKLNALIEKTAKFVGSHGGQMEIMIKTKQANNPQFTFLNFEHHLNAYYKHQVYMIKSGRYNPDIHNKPPLKQGGQADDSDEEDEGEGSGYLHPSLMAKSTTVSLQPTESVGVTPQYTQSQLENTAYGKLLKKMADNMPSLTNSPLRTGTPTYSDTDSTSQTGFADQATETHADQASAGQQAYTGADGQAYDPSCYNQYHQGYYQHSAGTIERPPSPPQDIKPLMERLLTYVKRSGDAFEKQVMLRKDERFSFLHAGDTWHEYYKWRKESVLGLDANGESLRSKGVSFSIKHKEPEPTTYDTNRAALPVDPESDDDQTSTSTVATTTVTTTITVAAVPIAAAPVTMATAVGTNGRNYTISASLPSSVTVSVPHVAAPRVTAPRVAVPRVTEPVRVEHKPHKSTPSDEVIQKKIAEQKLRDKLAAAAREKMTQVTQNTKEKSLQAERKRKAAMFVNMLKNKQKPPAELSTAMMGQDLPSGRSYSPDSKHSGYYSHSRSSHSRTRSPPPSAYSSQSSRSRDRHSDRHDSQRRRRHGEKSSRSRSRRSPSPLLSASKKVKITNWEVDLDPLPPPRTLQASARDTKSESSSQSSNKPGDSAANGGESAEFMSKVRKMLKESRKAVIKEDMFGD